MIQISDVDIIINGNKAKKYFHEGNWYIEAKKNSIYSLRIHNYSPVRKEAVVSIDGIDAISGKDAVSTNSGYIISGYNHIDIKGFRISDTEVREFTFSDKEQAFSTKLAKHKGISNPDHQFGVIGALLFNERAYYTTRTINTSTHPYYNPSMDFSTGGGSTFTCSLNSSTVYGANFETKSSSASNTPEFDLGTKAGSKIGDSVIQVPFTRANTDPTQFLIYYASRKALIDAGIITDKTTSLPTAFKDSKNNYCPDIC